MDPAPPPRPNAAGRAFGFAFAATVVPPLLVIGLTALSPGEDGLSVLIIGAFLCLLLDVGVLIVGIVRLATGRTEEGWSVLLGLLAGGIIGFGSCALILGGV